MTEFILAILLPLLATANAQAAPPTPDMTTIPLKSRGWGFSVSTIVNEATEAELVIDSGASYTIISTRLARALGINWQAGAPRYPINTAGGVVWVRLVTIGSLQAGGARAQRVEAAVADLPSFRGADGLLGKSFLDRYSYTINSQSATMILAPHKTGPLFGGRGEGWWRSQAQKLRRQASLFRAMELGAENSVYTGDASPWLLKQKFSRQDASRLAVYLKGLLEELEKEAAQLGAPEQWLAP